MSVVARFSSFPTVYGMLKLDFRKFQYHCLKFTQRIVIKSIGVTQRKGNLCDKHFKVVAMSNQVNESKPSKYRKHHAEGK